MKKETIKDFFSMILESQYWKSKNFSLKENWEKPHVVPAYISDVVRSIMEGLEGFEELDYPVFMDSMLKAMIKIIGILSSESPEAVEEELMDILKEDSDIFY